MQTKELKNLKPQLKVPLFHCGVIRYKEWNKGKLSYIQCHYNRANIQQ